MQGCKVSNDFGAKFWGLVKGHKNNKTHQSRAIKKYIMYI